jgi:hypothetical protein
MKLEDQIYKSIHGYPGLFYHKGHPTLSDYEISRLSVLEHLFMTNGNGYAWADGYLCECGVAEEQDYDGELGWIAEGPKYGVLTYADRTFPPVRTWSTKPNQRDEPATPDLFAWEYVERWKTFLGPRQFPRPAEWPFNIYQISSYSFKMPEFVQPDWLHGAKDICEFAIAFFASKTCLDGNNQKIRYEVRRRSVSFLKAKLKDINQRLSDVGEKE